MKCRICNASEDLYENTTEGNWNHEVCKECCREEVRRRSADAKENRMKGMEDPDAKLKCWKCEVAKHISAFPPYHVAGSSVGFSAKCVTCELEYRRSLQEQRSALLIGLGSRDLAPMPCGRCKTSLPMKAFSPGAILSWTKGSSCYCKACKKQYNADLYRKRKALKAAAKDDFSDLV